MSALRKRWVLLRHPQATIRFGKGTYLGPGFSLHIPHRGTFIAGEGVEFRRGFRAEVYGDAEIVIGDGSYFTYDPIIACSSRIEIGRRVGIGQNCYIVDGSHRYRDPDLPFIAQGFDLQPVTIGDDAAIHSKITIQADVGERAVIGSNAVITKPVPPYTLAAGVPARVLDYFGPPGREPPGWEGGAARDP